MKLLIVCTYVGALCATALCSPLGSAQDLGITYPSNYQSLPSRFATAPFPVAPHREITTPDRTTFRSLVIPTYRDTLRLGFQESYGTDNIYKQAIWGPTRQERKAIHDYLSDDAYLYLQLLSLSRKSAVLTDANLKFEKQEPNSNVIEYHVTPYGYMPRYHVGILASALLNNEQYLNYFCRRPEDCIPGLNRTPNEQAINQVFAYLRDWGGDPRNPFQVRAKYYDFLAKHLPTLRKWSATLPNEAYLVTKATPGNYDFAAGGFPLEILMPQGTDNYARSLSYYEPPDTKFRLGNQSATMENPTMGIVSANVVVKLAPAMAEKILEELKRDYGRQLPYFFVVLKVRILGLNSDFKEYGSGITFYYDLLDNNVALFKDDALTQSIGNVRLTK